jgi:hypothetical protein
VTPAPAPPSDDQILQFHQPVIDAAHQRVADLLSQTIDELRTFWPANEAADRSRRQVAVRGATRPASGGLRRFPDGY